MFCADFAYWIRETAWNCHHHHRRPSHVKGSFALQGNKKELFLLKKKRKKKSLQSKNKRNTQPERAFKKTPKWVTSAEPPRRCLPNWGGSHQPGKGEGLELELLPTQHGSALPFHLLGKDWRPVSIIQTFLQSYTFPLQSPDTNAEKNGVTGR